MDDTLAGVLSGGANLIGGYFQNQANSAQAQRQMDFQRSMSDSAHQREVADLRAAGLNPILSAGGPGASSPAGAMADQQNLGPSVGQGIATAMAVKAQQKDFQQKDSAIANTDADTKNKEATAGLINMQSANAAADTKMKLWQTNQIQEMLPHLVKKAKVTGDWAQVNEILGAVQSGAASAGSVLGLGNTIKSLIPSGKLDLPSVPIRKSYMDSKPQPGGWQPLKNK